MKGLKADKLNIVIFGTGLFYQNRKSNISEQDNIVVFIDNKADEKDTFEGKRVVFPCEISKYDYDIVLIMAKDEKAMISQLLNLRVDITKIWTYEEYLRRAFNNYHVYSSNTNSTKERILIITDGLKYDGGALASINIALAMIPKGYDVTIAAAFAEEKMLSEVLKLGVSVIISSRLPYIGKSELSDFIRFDYIIVNTFPMLPATYILSSYKNVLWWIHEPADCELYCFYRETKRIYWQYVGVDHIKRNGVRILTVSNIARKSFEAHYPKLVDGNMPMAVKDNASDKCVSDSKISFAIIGVLNRPKGQVELLKAFLKLKDMGYEAIRCELIGKRLDENFCKELDGYICQSDDIEYLGILDRTQLRKQFERIDVVVCASYEETLSLTIIEGMMNSKICITTDNTGIAEYIEDGVNGFICKAGDVESLREKMQYVIDHFDELDDMRKKARQTYEKYFTLEVLGENLEREINIAEGNFSASRSNFQLQ